MLKFMKFMLKIIDMTSKFVMFLCLYVCEVCVLGCLCVCVCVCYCVVLFVCVLKNVLKYLKFVKTYDCCANVY
jgi:hypothetical protein